MKKALGNMTKLLLIFFLTSTLFAEVKVSLSSPAVYKGDVVNFSISVDGRSIQFPQISEINGSAIIGTSQSESISMINSHIIRNTTKTYNFKPTASLTIPSYEIIIDEKTVKTKELTVSVLKPTASKNGSNFVLELKLNKQEAYVGEAVELSITYKQKLNLHVEQVQLSDPKLENFWAKKIEKTEDGGEGEYLTQTIHYQLFPQKSGEYTIPAMEALIGQISRQKRGGFLNDPFFSMGNQLNWKKIYSNELKLKVNPLPNGLELYGNYQIEASVDKTKVQANKPINLNIEVKGEGNIDDVKKFDVAIDNVIVYADEPNVNSSLVRGIYQGAFKQKIALIADQNFTVPPLSLEYFDKATKQIKTITTKAIKIEVIGGEKTAVHKASSIEVSPSQIIKAPQKVETKTKIIIEKEDAYLKYLFLLIGFVLGILLMLIIHKPKQKKSKKENNIVKNIHKAKNDRTLFDILLPYAKQDKVINNALSQLEENLYRKGNNIIDRELLMEVFEEKNL